MGNSHLFQFFLKYSKTNFLLSIIMCFVQVIISSSGSEEIWICVNIYRQIIVISNWKVSILFET